MPSLVYKDFLQESFIFRWWEHSVDASPVQGEIIDITHYVTQIVRGPADFLSRFEWQELHPENPVSPIAGENYGMG